MKRLLPLDEPGRIAVAPVSLGLVTAVFDHERYTFVTDLPRRKRMVAPWWAMRTREVFSQLAPGVRIVYRLIPSMRRPGAFLPYEAEIMPEGVDVEADGEIEFIPEGTPSRGRVSGLLPGRAGFVVDDLTHRPASFTLHDCRARGTWDTLKPGMGIRYFLVRSRHAKAPANSLMAIDVVPATEDAQEARPPEAEAFDPETETTGGAPVAAPAVA